METYILVFLFLLAITYNEYLGGTTCRTFGPVLYFPNLVYIIELHRQIRMRKRVCVLNI